MVSIGKQSYVSHAFFDNRSKTNHLNVIADDYNIAMAA